MVLAKIPAHLCMTYFLTTPKDLKLPDNMIRLFALGRLTLGGVLIAILFAGGKSLLRQSSSSNYNSDGSRSDQFAPASGEMSEVSMMANAWSFSWAAGSYEVRFLAGGEVELKGEDGLWEGRWRVEDRALHLSVPEKKYELQGFHKDSVGVIYMLGEAGQYQLSRLASE
ncbi:MAG: hypothetical protein ACI8XO_003354 [Verrucomicrobiales bacterium]